MTRYFTEVPKPQGAPDSHRFIQTDDQRRASELDAMREYLQKYSVNLTANKR